MDIINAVSYILKDVSAVVSIVVIMHFIFLEKNAIKKSKALLCAVFIVLNSIIGIFVFMKHSGEAADMMDFISNVICILAVRLFTSEKRWGRSIWVVMLYLMTADMIYSLFTPFIPQGLLTECLFDTVLFSAVGLAVYVFAAKSAVNVLPKVFDEIPRWVFVGVMLFDLACYYKQFGLSQEWYNAFYTVSSIMVVLCIVYLLFKIFSLSYEQNKAIVQIQRQSEFYSEKLKNENDLRHFRHDYKNHMIVVDSYLRNGDTQSAREYLSSLNEQIHSSLEGVSTGNFVADAVLNNKIHFARQKNISFSFSGVVPEKGIEPQDLCMILSNLIDNAIEGSEADNKERYINVSTFVRNNNFILTVTNNCADNKIRRKGLFLTTKKDKAVHGIGLKNVLSAVKKYSGELITECENGVFTADVRLKIKK